MKSALVTIFAVLPLLIRTGCCGTPPATVSPLVHRQEIDASSFDQYGGSTHVTCSGGPRGKFYTEKIGDRWWLCTPEGNVFWAMGVYQAIPDNSTDLFGINHYALVGQKYKQGPTTSGQINWCIQTVRRLKSWGFNTLDMYAYRWITPWTDQGSNFPKDQGSDRSTLPEKMPAMPSNIKPSHYALFNNSGYVDQAVKDLMAGIKSSSYTGWRAPIADYYDARFSGWMAANMATYPSLGSYANWLLGVVVDDTDYLWWAGAGPAFATVPAGHNSTHAGWATLITAPVLTASRYNGINLMFADATTYTKRQLAAFLEEKYGGLSEFNAAWNSSYTTFGSTGTLIEDETVAFGDGMTSTFSYALSRPSPFSVQILVNGKAQGGDNGGGAFLTVGGRTAGKIDYAGGALSIVLDTPAAENARVSVKYVSCGFGCGTGLLDEDGTHGWVPRAASSDNRLTGGGAQVAADLDAFLYVYAAHYFATVKENVNRFYPGHLYLGPTSIGAWGTPARKEVLQAAAQYVDVLRITQVDPIKTGPDWLDRLNFIAQWGGDKPWTAWVGGRANPDSYFANDPRGAGGGCASTMFQTQAQRGEWYQTVLQSLSQPTIDGIRHMVGVNFWELIDNRPECANWGLMTRRDNPYDGVSAVKASGKDPWGYDTGGETADYGDFLSGVKAANRLWVPEIPHAEEGIRFRDVRTRGIGVRW